MKITEVSLQKNNKDRANVYLDGEYVLSLDCVDAVVLGIKPGREISHSELENLLMESQLGKARSKAMDIISRKPVTGFLLKQELIKKGYDEIVVDELVRELGELGILDDYAYTLLFVEMSAEKLWGRKKVEYELKQKGIDSNMLEDALCEISLPGEEEICSAIAARYKGEDLADARTKQRVVRFFASRGFDFSVIDRGINLYLKRN